MSAIALGALLAIVGYPLTRGVLRSPHGVWWGLFGGTLLLMPLVWMALGKALDLFLLSKTLFICGCGVGVALLRTDPDRWEGIVTRLTPWALALNIGLAVVSEAAAGGWINPLLGLTLCVTVPSARSVRVERGDVAALHYDLRLVWILAYTVWNAVFVYSTGPPGGQVGGSTWLAGLHLGVPLVIALRAPDRWMEARGVALLFFLLWWDTLQGTPLVPLPAWTTPSGHTLAQAFAGVTAVAVLLWDLRHGDDGRRTLLRSLAR